VGRQRGQRQRLPAAPGRRPRPTVGGELKVAGANLLNFFNTFSGCTFGTAGGPADCRGADNSTEYQRQLAKEVAAISFLDADIVGYMEMENDGYGPSSAVQAFVDALNAEAGPGTWAFVDPDAALGIVDSAGTDAIKAGLIYRTASVTPVAGATFADQDPIFQRRPVAQTFATADGGRVTVVANHFKSKGSCPASGPDTDQGDGQACWNAQRTDQAIELAEWLDDVVIPAAGDPDVLVVGDLNAYAGEDPIAALEAAGYVNLIKLFGGLEAYSYVFDGQWGYLDHALASASLVDQVTGSGDAHHNADEPLVLDYNTEFKSAGQIASLYAPDRFRSSDHDPVLVGLDLAVAPVITGTPGPAAVGQPYSFAFTVSGTEPITVSLSSGSLPPGLGLSADGVLSGSPTQRGTFAFDVTATNSSGSSTHSTTVVVAGAPTTLTLASSANPSSFGDPVTFTATVGGAVAGLPPGGTVTFSAGGSQIGDPVPVVDGSATSIPVSDLPAGTTTVTATYSGDGAYDGSNATLDQVVTDPPPAAAVGVAAGTDFSCGISSGAVKCWGTNGSGQLGDGSTIRRLTPVSVSGISDAVVLVAGRSHTCAIRQGGTVACWGANDAGQLGDGTTSRRLTPVPVSGLSNAVDLAAGERHTCALLGDGTVKCWGDNGNGQLGDGTQTRRSTPVSVTGLSGATDVAAGNNTTCAVTAGAVKCWGSDSGGHLGNGGANTNSSVPVTVSGLSDATQVDVGMRHACAVRAGGGVRCWGANGGGSLGDGTTTQRTTPVDVVGISTATQVSVGNDFSCARLADASVRCWGWNGPAKSLNSVPTPKA